jgi:hypothetical protein
LTYFGQAALGIDIWPDGDFFISTSSNYEGFHVMPFNNSSPYISGLSYFNQVINSMDLSILSSKIRSAYSTTHGNFTAKFAYTITWLLTLNNFDMQNLNITFYQVILCSDGVSSFMIVSYEQMDFTPDKPSFYFDTLLQENTFMPSITDSNCNVSGQFIFQLNTVSPEPSPSLFLQFLY